MKHTQSILSKAVQGALVLGACSAAVPAYAVQWDFDNDFSFSVDTTLAYAAQWRTQGRDPKLSYDDSDDPGVFNANDGNNNFDPGLVSSRGSMILEVGGVYKNFSFFVRGDALYDYVYVNQKTDISDANYLTYNNGFPVGGTVKQGDFPDATIDAHGKRTRLLDAFVTYSFNAGNQGGAVRLGRQVIAWGESQFYTGINALQNPLDAVSRAAPGTEAREFILPTGAIDLKWDFTYSFSAEAYYKLEWERSTLPGVGSYWSTSDLTGPGADKILLGPLLPGNRVDSATPRTDGQWGLAGRFTTEGGTDFALYYVNAHSNIPGVEVNVGLAGDSWYREIYTEDIENFGASVSFNVSEAQVYADFSYSPNMPLVNQQRRFTPDGRILNSDVSQAHYWQVSAGFLDLYTALPKIAPQIALTAEALYTSNNLGESSLDVNPYNASREAWGYQASLVFRYFAVIPGLDMNIITFFKHDVAGYGSGIGYNGLNNNAKTALLGWDGFYLTNWQFGVKYAWFFGDDPGNKTRDRDNFSISAKYVF